MTNPAPKTIVIVGGNGGMGKLFARALRAQKHVVRCLGRRSWARAPKLIPTADLVIVTVPIDATETMIKETAKYMRKDSILADFTSIKAAPMKIMLKAHAGPVLGLHPVFGPTIRNFKHQVIVHCPGRSPRKCQWVLKTLTDARFTMHKMSAQDHDEIMSIIQGIKHFSTYALGCFLKERHGNLEEIMKLASPIYRLDMNMMGRIFSQSPELYADIIMSDSKRTKIIESFVNFMHKRCDEVKDGNRETFIKRFEKTADWMGDFTDAALKESDRIINRS